MREFKISKNPNDCGTLYYRDTVTFEPGLTVLVGCNGCGKSTLIRQIAYKLEKAKIPYVKYDNLHDGNTNARSKAAFYGDYSFLGTSLMSSEGENVVLNLGNVAREIGTLVRCYPESKELWILLDAIDSGLSIDNVVELKEQLFDTIFEHNKDKDVYIITASNEFELCRGEKCFDTYLCKYIDIKSYDDYREFILKSRERKDKREAAQAKKQATRRRKR